MSDEKQTQNEDSGKEPSPEAASGSNKNSSEPAETVEDRKLKIERSVEDIFSKFANETDHDKKSPQKIEDPIGIKIELFDDQDVGPEDNELGEKSAKADGKSYRRIYTIGGIFILLAVVAAFYLFKSGEKRPGPEPSKTSIVQKITPPPLQPSPEKQQPKIAPKIEKAPDPNDGIKAFLINWKTAWEKSAGKQGDIDTYMSFYDDNFISEGMNKAEWRRDKIKKNRGKKWIRLKLEDIEISSPTVNDQVEIRFLLIYNSSNYSDKSKKILVLKKEGSGWKITGIKAVEMHR